MSDYLIPDSKWEINNLWERWIMDCGDYHIIPKNDTHEHVFTMECACCPEPDEDMDNLIMHNSFDGREDFENGKRKPS